MKKTILFLLLCISSNCYAIFPTTSVLDDFNRADNTTLGVNWTDGLNGFSISGNQAVGENAGWNITTYNTAPGSANQECYITVSNVATGGTAGIYLRWDGVGGNGYGISAHFDAGNHYINYYRTDNFVDSDLAQIPQTFSNGDSLGAIMIGSTLDVYYKPASGSWTFLRSFTSSTYSNAGKLEIISYGTGVKIDNFSGGAYNPQTSTITNNKKVYKKGIFGKWKK